MRTVEVFADVLCPFTHAGLHTLIDRRAQLGHTEPRLRIRAWPLELINGKPLDPHHIGTEVAALRASVRPDLFAGFSADTFPTTSMTAFALTAAADRADDATLSEAVGIALRDAVFEEGLDIGLPEVVAPIAERFGLEPLDADATSAAVRADWAEGRERGVVGSPHFFVGGGAGMFCPVLDISRDDVGDFVIAWKQGTEDFVNSLLG
ncbi:DsbA family protein [Mycobacterium sp. CVI_P3]|uniref:DsbA family protein n=1 Tax=Mycobacterium pinniadriaticum TaxID=2994102 RepID=A0ABT3SM84_9MYCO|nr:DsbA family protein [Mycobacterium pinniadriaticum]MCX2933874.1 DsbA family protein [Mycobacterium pinniadriaticum]MCX2940273.1 DsbA family protein [Mycobacterium pinniadriaticum]